MSVISYADAVNMENIYLGVLGVCTYLNRSNKLLLPSLIVVVFATFSSLFLFDFLWSQGPHIWTIGWVCYLLSMMTLFLLVRYMNRERIYLTDLILLLACGLHILIFSLTYVARVVLKQGWMDFIYSVTGPAMSVIIVLALIFPSLYKLIVLIKENKLYGNDSSFSGFFRYFNNRFFGIFGL